METITNVLAVISFLWFVVCIVGVLSTDKTKFTWLAFCITWGMGFAYSENFRMDREKIMTTQWEQRVQELRNMRIPVYQGDHLIGTLPYAFSTRGLKGANNPFVDFRPGDIVRQEKGWVVSKSLGPGDIGAIPGFAPVQTDTKCEVVQNGN